MNFDDLDDFDSQPMNGLVIMALRMRREDNRKLAIDRLWDIGDRVTPTIFEIATESWDQGLLEELLAWLSDLLEGTRDTIVVWKFENNRFVRFVLSE